MSATSLDTDFLSLIKLKHVMLPCSQISQGELKPPTRIEGPAAHALSQTCNHLTLPCNECLGMPSCRPQCSARCLHVATACASVYVCVCEESQRFDVQILLPQADVVNNVIYQASDIITCHLWQ